MIGVDDFFDFNDAGPAFSQFGDAQETLGWAASVVQSGPSSVAEREHAAVLAAGLALPRLAALAKCNPNDLAALQSIGEELGRLANKLKKMLPQRKSGRPKPDDKLRKQATAVIGLHWLTKIRKGALPMTEGRRTIGKIIPEALRSKRLGERLSGTKQLENWEDSFSRGPDEQRQQIRQQVNDEMRARFAEDKSDPLNCTSAQVLEWVRGELNAPVQ